jgi:hypothetical protein
MLEILLIKKIRILGHKKNFFGRGKKSTFIEITSTEACCEVQIALYCLLQSNISSFAALRASSSPNMSPE